MRLRLSGVAFTLGFLVCAAPLASLADDVELFGGGQLDFSNYVFIGATVPVSTKNGNGLAVRGLVDTGGYDYVSNNLGTVSANFGGGELDVLYKVSRTNFWSDLGAGVNDTYTGLTPEDQSNPLRGQQVELRLSTDGGTASGPWRADWYGYYGARLQDYAAMVGLTHSLSTIWRLGGEVYSEGNPTYSLYQVGPYAGLAFTKNSELQFSAGEAWESGLTPRAYVRATFYAGL